MKLDKRLGFFSIMVLIVLSALELFSFLAGLILHEDLFSHERQFISTLDPSFLEKTLNSPFYSAELGWDIPEAYDSDPTTDCAGNAVPRDSSVHRARITAGLEGRQPKVALFGDSYAHGDEVNDEQTIASVLTLKHDIPTLNFGVTAYGPTQAYLKFERERQTHAFDTAVLLIMHENIRRAVNSFRPVLAPYTENKLAFKPYTRDGRILANTRLTGWEDALAHVRQAFRSDYWATPQFKFPYTLSLARAVIAPSFRDRVSNKIFGVYSFEYGASSPLLLDLQTIIEHFVATSKSAGIRPLVVFVPLNKSTHLVAQPFADKMNGLLGETVVVDLDLTGIDWEHYNIKRNLCHPSAYGYEMLADHLAPYLR